MKFIRPLALALTVGLLTPIAALAQNQSLPPMDTGYNTGYQQQYTQQQQYGTQQQYGGYQQYAPQQSYQQAPLQGRVVTAPQGTMVSVTSTTTISSETAAIGQPVSVTLSSPIAGGGSILIPAGSQIQGQVANVNKAHRAFGDFGELDIRFTSATLPNGQTIPLSAHIQTADGRGVIRGGSTKGRVGKAALKTGLGAGAGALAGLVAASMSGGAKGRATALMVPVGAGAGLLASGLDKGEEAVLNAGEPINIVLDQPLSTSPFADSGSYSQMNNGGYNNGYNQNYNSGYGQTPAYNNYSQPNPYPTYQQNTQPTPFYGSGQ